MILRKLNLISDLLLPSALAVISVLSGSCSTSEKSGSTDHFVVDAASSSDEAAQQLQSLVKMTAIKLRMPDSVVLKAKAASIVSSDCPDRFVLCQNGFYVFGRDGELSGYFNRKGQGPEEYNSDIAASMQGDTVYVLDQTKIQRYDISGNYISTISGIDGSRGKLAVSQSGMIYLQHRFNAEDQLSVYMSDGELFAEMFPSEEVVRDFMIPSSPEITTIGSVGKSIYIAPPLEQTIYLVEDTTARPMATFDFGRYNIPEDFYDGSTEEVEARFHNRRDHRNGYVYLDAVYVGDDWLTATPTGIPDQDYHMIMADRRTGATYTDLAFPRPLKMILGNNPYFCGYDAATKSFVKVVSGDILTEAMESCPGSIEKANFDSINEEDDDFIILVSFE